MVFPTSQIRLRAGTERVRHWISIQSTSQDLINDWEMVVKQINSVLEIQSSSLQVSRLPWLLLTSIVLPSVNLPGLTPTGFWPTQSPLLPTLSGSSAWLQSELPSNAHLAAAAPGAEGKAGNQTSARPRPAGLLRAVSLPHVTGWRTEPSSFSIKKAGAGQGNQQSNKLEETLHHSYSNRKQNHKVTTRRGEKERIHKHFQKKRIFPNVKCTDNLMEFTWFSPLRVRKSNYKVIITSYIYYNWPAGKRVELLQKHFDPRYIS